MKYCKCIIPNHDVKQITCFKCDGRMKKKPTHGGKRKGSGRPKKEPTTTLRVPTSKVEAIKKLISNPLKK